MRDTMLVRKVLFRVRDALASVLSCGVLVAQLGCDRTVLKEVPSGRKATIPKEPEIQGFAMAQSNILATLTAAYDYQEHGADETAAKLYSDAFLLIRHQEAIIYLLRGESKYHSGRYEEAIQDYEQSQTRIPTSHTMWCLFLCYEWLGQYTEATNRLEEWTRTIAPENKIQTLMVGMLRRLPSEALYGEVESWDDDAKPSAYYYLCERLRARGDIETARVFAEKYLRLLPEEYRIRPRVRHVIRFLQESEAKARKVRKGHQTVY